MSSSLIYKFHESYTPLPETGCWLWNACGGKTRYGTFYDSSSKKMIRATRFIYEQTHGKIPDGMVVRHKCDVSLCVNPDHLEIGTQTDNMRDMVDRGRQYDKSGLKNPNAKLSHSDIAFIRNQPVANGRTGVTNKELADKFSCSEGTITKIRSGKHYSNIEYDPD